MKSLNEYLQESILSTTGAGSNSIVMSNMIKYLKDIKDGGEQHGVKGPGVIDLYIPGTSREKRLDGVFKFWFPRSKHNSKTAQFYKKVMAKSGYKNELEATGDLTLSFELSKVKDGIYYSPLEPHLNVYWENRVFKIGEVYMILSFVKEPRLATTTLYVYALNPDGTISQNLTNEIKKALS